MKRKNSHSGNLAALRRQAEEVARKRPPPPLADLESPSPEEMQRTIHELRVHQIELEMQNEELRRAQVELDSARAWYFDLYDMAPVGYVTISKDGLILEANLTVAKLLGAAQGKLVKQPIHRFILKEDQDIYYLHRQQLVATGEPQICELRMIKGGGAFFWAHLEAVETKDKHGAPLFRIVLSDISIRKRSEEALERVRDEVENERLRLETVMEVLPTGVAITDALGGTVLANKEFDRIWAGPRPVTRSVEDYGVFKGWWADTGEPVAPKEWASAQAVHEDRSVVGQILEIQRFDGSRAFVINSAAPVHNAAGNIIGSAVAIQDITNLRKADLRIQELNVALQEHVATVDAVNKELESYSHSVSHDLRTPLRFVSRIAYLLLTEPGAQLSKNAVEQVNMILRATDEMAQLIEKLLLFSQASRAPIRKRRIDTRRLFQEVVKELQNGKGGGNVDIVIQELAPLQGDRILLKEVVANLLENALKFTRLRERSRITVGSSETNAETVYFVQDNGVGFDMRDSDALFVPFLRLHKAADFEGTGIGLALVKRIIERHGGRLWATGEVDKGATFYFTLGEETKE